MITAGLVTGPARYPQSSRAKRPPTQCLAAIATRPVLWVGLLLALFSAGCGNYHVGSENSVAADLHRQAQDLDALRDQGVGAVTQVVPKKAHLQQILVPKDAPWLAYPATAVYRDADPKVVLAGLLGEHPVVYQLSRPESTPRVSHTGGEATLKDYLDAIMIQTNWSYRLHGGVMIVSDILAREFRLLVPPGARSYNLGKSSLESDSGGGSNDLSGGEDPYEALASAMTSLGFEGDGGGDQADSDDDRRAGNRDRLDSDRDELRDSRPSDGVASLFGSPLDAAARAGAGRSGRRDEPVFDPNAIDGASFAIMQSVGIMVVRGRPDQVRAAEDLVRWFNAGHNNKAVVEIAIYEIDFRRKNQRQLDLSLLRSAGLGAAVWSNGPSIDSGIGSGGLSLQLNDPGSRLQGSAAVLNWLRQHGHTSIQIHRRLELTNNEVATIESRRTNPYVESLERELVTQNDVSRFETQVELGETDTGWAMNILPTIDSGTRDISVRLNLSRATLVSYFEYNFGSGDGGVSGSVPVVDKQNDVITVALHDGEAKIITNVTISEIAVARGQTPYLPLVGDSVRDDQHSKDFVLYVSAVLVD